MVTRPNIDSKGGRQKASNHTLLLLPPNTDDEWNLAFHAGKRNAVLPVGESTYAAIGGGDVSV